MNAQPPPITAPPVPQRTSTRPGCPPVMMRDILLKTMYRMSLSRVSEIARTICLPIPQAIELIDRPARKNCWRRQRTCRQPASSEASFQLTEAGKARAVDALSQSEYYGAMPVPLDAGTPSRSRAQSIRNIQITRRQLQIAMGDLILPPRLIDRSGPGGQFRVGRSCCMARREMANPPSPTASARRWAIASTCRARSPCRAGHQCL